MTTELQTYARRAHTAGLCVVPAKPDGSKAPAGFWKQYQTERPPVDYLDSWFDNTHPTYDGLGYVCGAVSGNLEMVEFEGRAVDEGIYDQLLEAAGALGLDHVLRVDAGYCEISPSGGIHWLYRVADHPVDGNLKLARRPAPTDDNPHAVDVLIETRGEGGFTVAAPSGGRTHPTGRPWRILHGDVDTIATITADERAALLDLCRTFDQMPAPAYSLTAPGEMHIPVQTAAGDYTATRPGDRYNRETTWADILEPLGWTLVYRRDDVGYWRRPGKTHGVSATTNALGTDRLKVFSSSTVFDTETTYDKLGAYAALNHRGDVRAAAVALAPVYGDHDRTTPASLIGDSLRPNPVLQRLHDDQQQPDAGQEDEDVDSWAPIDLGQYLDGNFEPIKPTVGYIGEKDNPDGFLFYRKRTSVIFGASGDGKTWIAYGVVAQILMGGEHALWLDLEDSPEGTIERLQLLGVTDAAIRRRFHYFNPDEAMTAAGRAHIARLIDDVDPVIAVIDSTGESFALEGVKPNDDDLVAAWGRAIPRWIARQGPAVVLVDHIAKSKDADPLFAIGSQRKRAMLDGAAYLAQMVVEFGRGRLGRTLLTTAKDRGGHHQRGQGAAMFTLDATDRPYRYRLDKVEAVDPHEAEQRKLTYNAQRVSEWLQGRRAESQTSIVEGVGGKAVDIRAALDKLIAGGYVVVEERGRGRYHTLARPFLAETEAALETLIGNAA